MTSNKKRSNKKRYSRVKKSSHKKQSSSRKRLVKQSKLADSIGYMLLKYKGSCPKVNLPVFHKSVKLINTGTDFTTHMRDIEWRGPGNQIPSAQITLKEALNEQKKSGQISTYRITTRYVKS